MKQIETKKRAKKSRKKYIYVIYATLNAVKKATSIDI